MGKDIPPATAQLEVTVGRIASAMIGFAFCHVAPAQTQGLGVSNLGVTGGLVIPSAYVLAPGDLALSAGNYQDPKLGTFSKKQNYALGIGLIPRVEIFGRFAEYQNPPPASPSGYNFDSQGARDISVNVKWQLPIELRGLPTLAVGATDISGGAVYFASKYVVASDEYDSLRWSLGYARGNPPGSQSGGAKVLNDMFGGAELRLGNTQATALAESDGTQRHVGLRYYSKAIPWLGDGQVVGTVQRSFGATTLAGRAADNTSFNVSLILPMGTADKTRRARANDIGNPLPPLRAGGVAPVIGGTTLVVQSQLDLKPSRGLTHPNGGMVATAQDRADGLARALRATGLDRVRVGTLGDQLVVEYENRRYLQNEVDSLGIVLGLAAEFAPASTQRVRAMALKSGLEVLVISVDLAAYRGFLRDGDASTVKDYLSFSPAAEDTAPVQWAAGDAGAGGRKTWLRVEVKPLLNYTLGTEFGAFDYSLAANVRSSVSLWKGAEAYVDVVQRLANTSNTEPGRVFASSLHRNGVKTVAVQQSFWLSPRLFTSVGAGQYEYKGRGAEGESVLFSPWNNDTAHVKGSYIRRQDNVLPRVSKAYGASYRWKFDADTWIEPGYQKYTDLSKGPSLTFTRWFGDVAVQLFGRKGGNNTFVGLELSLPLGPRQGLVAGPVLLTGAPRYAQSFRTRLTNGGNTGNFVENAAVRPVDLSYKPEIESLNSGRITPEYIKGQVQRMREAFYLFARSELN